MPSTFERLYFRFIVKLRRRYRDFLDALCPPCMHSLPHYQHPPPEGTFVMKIDEPTLTDHNPPKSVVYVRVHAWCCDSTAFDKCVMVYIHHYSITQSIFTTLKHPDFHLFFLPRLLIPNNHRSFYYLHSFYFSKMSRS